MNTRAPSALELRTGLEEARLLLVFTPTICRPGRSILETVEASLPWIDAIQVRIKHPVDPRWASPASETFLWTERILDLLAAHSGREWLVILNDRVDVARALAHRGVAGVHIGADDCPPPQARSCLGPDLLIGLSTHSMQDVVAAEAQPVDYLGFGPVHATKTKPAAGGLGSEAAWIAARASFRPVFPIGGIDPTNAGELTRIGRAAVSSGILGAEDPERAARLLRAELLAPEG